MEIIIKQLSPALLDDYLFFFDNITFCENPDWSKCYCFSFHFTGASHEWTKDSNRQAVINYINEGKMSGYLAYSDNKPIGWCNVNDKHRYQSLTKYYDVIQDSKDKACSIVCFLIDPEYRRQGISRKLLERICADYSTLGYDYIEAYPGKGELSSEKNYKGPLELYRKFDFKIQKENKDYLVVRKKLP